ncbi:hypothetical protein O9992_08010 [Vibrio lentus]|nr:hypothetical protein [Vibrio lentus]
METGKFVGYRVVGVHGSIAFYCGVLYLLDLYGTVGQASNNPLSFLPIYLLYFSFHVGVADLGRLILIAKREHITSIADFIAVRYGKSQGWLLPSP